MSGDLMLTGLAGVLAATAPILLVVLGETISERGGIINLSLNGLVILSAMVSFAAAATTGSLLAGFAAGIAVGALTGLLVAFCSITLRQSQVAIGFVLALLCRDLAYFFGNRFMNVPGPVVSGGGIPGLGRLPIVGELLFNQDVVTWLSFGAIVLAWWWMFKTRPGLTLRAIGEHPAAAHARGAGVNRLRYVYTVAGSAMVGLAGAAYSLSVKAGWRGTISGLDGIGWIALAIVVFGGWNPVRAALGAYLFGLLQWLGVVLQPCLPGVPSQVLQVAPFPLMILALLLVNIGNAEWVEKALGRLPPGAARGVRNVLRALRGSPPAALGQPYESP